jgi:hypothetical protein
MHTVLAIPRHEGSIFPAQRQETFPLIRMENCETEEKPMFPRQRFSSALLVHLTHASGPCCSNNPDHYRSFRFYRGAKPRSHMAGETYMNKIHYVNNLAEPMLRFAHRGRGWAVTYVQSCINPKLQVVVWSTTSFPPPLRACLGGVGCFSGGRACPSF